jgi:hypothetical protein
MALGLQEAYWVAITHSLDLAVLLGECHVCAPGGALMMGLPAAAGATPTRGSKSSIDLSEYLDLALREYLAMRDEMNALIRLELSLILGALAVVGGATATVAADIAGIDEIGRAFVLQVVGTFSLIIFITALGVANDFIILEAYITSSAAEIERLANQGETRHLASVQRKIRRWTRQRTMRNTVAWAISYGTTQILAAIALLVVGAIAFIGYAGTTKGDSLVVLARTAFGVADAVLALLGLAILVGSLMFANRWDAVMGD